MALLEYHHYEYVSSSNNPNGEHDIVFSQTQDAKIHMAGLTIYGPELESTQYGLFYLWRDDATHFTCMLPVNKGTPKQAFWNLSPPLVIPAGEDWCFKWNFDGLGTTGRTIFCDIAYELV